MPQSHQAARVYDALEELIRSVVPSDCRIFQANMPLQLMDQLARESARICTYLVFQDRRRQNSSGATLVHDISVEFSFYGSLAAVDDMTTALTGLFTGSIVESSGWRFCLHPNQQSGRRDVWEPRISVKREWLQFEGIAIEPEAETESEEAEASGGNNG